jgi:release factor glutamine methyltransferase
MNSSEKSLTFDNCTFLLSKDVYEPSEDTFLLADSFQVKETDTVLDMGTGCGIIGILIAKKVKDVVAIDINRQAVRCSRTNAKLNEVSEKISFLTADLFQSIKVSEQFDLIVFNAPYLPSEKEEQELWIERAWAGGPSGRQVIDKFLNDAPNYLKNDGRILLVQSTLSNVSKTLRKLEKAGLKVEVMAEKKEAFETIVVIKAIQQLKKRPLQ